MHFFSKLLSCKDEIWWGSGCFRVVQEAKSTQARAELRAQKPINAEVGI